MLGFFLGLCVHDFSNLFDSTFCTPRLPVNLLFKTLPDGYNKKLHDDVVDFCCTHNKSYTALSQIFHFQQTIKQN